MFSRPQPRSIRDPECSLEDIARMLYSYTGVRSVSFDFGEDFARTPDGSLFAGRRQLVAESGVLLDIESEISYWPIVGMDARMGATCLAAQLAVYYRYPLFYGARITFRVQSNNSNSYRIVRAYILPDFRARAMLAVTVPEKTFPSWYENEVFFDYMRVGWGARTTEIEPWPTNSYRLEELRQDFLYRQAEYEAAQQPTTFSESVLQYFDEEYGKAEYVPSDPPPFAAPPVIIGSPITRTVISMDIANPQSDQTVAQIYENDKLIGTVTPGEVVTLDGTMVYMQDGRLFITQGGQLTEIRAPPQEYTA